MLTAAINPALIIVPSMFALFFAIVIAIFVVSSKMAKKRSDEFQQAAASLGLSFEIEPCDAARMATSDAHLMSRGHSKKYRNLVTASTDELQIQIFDYRFTTGGGKNSQTHFQTVALITSPALQTPSFRARPESMFDSIGGALGFQDIDFDDHPGFSKAFVLKSDAEDQTRAYFDLTLLDFFVTKPKISFEGSPGLFLFYEAGRGIKPADLPNLLRDAYKVFDALRDRTQRA